MTIYFTSDLHLYHNNIINFENRSFGSVEEMNSALIATWNNTIKPDDIVYNLGDFIFGGITRWKEILPQLNGKMRLILGNHDDRKVVRKLATEGYFDEFHEVGTFIKVNGYSLNLTHYPMEIGNRPRSFSISGHIHSTPSRLLTQVNVGIDSPLNFNRPFSQPISLDELITYLDYINPKIEEIFKLERGITE